MSINSNGKIAGTATGTGLFPINVTVTDAIGDHMSQNYTLAIGPAMAVGDLSETQWTVNEPGFAGAMTISGGQPATFTIVSSTGLPNTLGAIRER